MSVAKVANPSNDCSEAESLKRQIILLTNLINNRGAQQKGAFFAYSQKSANFRNVQVPKYPNAYNKYSSNPASKYIPPKAVNGFSWSNKRNKSAYKIDHTVSKTCSDSLQLIKASCSTSSDSKFLPKTVGHCAIKSLKSTKNACNYSAPKPKQSTASVINVYPVNTQSKSISSTHSLHKASLLNTTEEIALFNNKNVGIVSISKNSDSDLESLKENCTNEHTIRKDVFNHMETAKKCANQVQSKIQTSENQASKLLTGLGKGLVPGLLESKNHDCHKHHVENNLKLDSTVSSRHDSHEVQIKNNAEYIAKFSVEADTNSDGMTTKKMKSKNELNICNIITEPIVEHSNRLEKIATPQTDNVGKNSNQFGNSNSKSPKASDWNGSFDTSVTIKCSTPKTHIVSLDQQMKTLKQQLKGKSLALSKAKAKGTKIKQTQTFQPKSINIVKSKYKLLNKNLSNKRSFSLLNHSKLSTSLKLELPRNGQSNCEVKSTKLSTEAKSLKTSYTLKKSPCHCFKNTVASNSQVRLFSANTKIVSCSNNSCKKLKYKKINKTVPKHCALIGSARYRYLAKTSPLLHKYSLRHANIVVKKNLALSKTSNSRYKFVKSAVQGTPKANNLTQLKYSKKLIKKYKVVNKHSPKLNRSTSKYNTTKSSHKCLKTKYKVVNKNISQVCRNAMDSFSNMSGINSNSFKNCSKLKSSALMKSFMETPNIKSKLKKTFAKSFQMSLCKKTGSQSLVKATSKYKYCASNLQKSLIRTRNSSFVALKLQTKLSPVVQAVRMIKTKYQIVNKRIGYPSTVSPWSNCRKKYNFKRKLQKSASFVGQHKNRSYKAKNWYMYDAYKTWQPQFTRHNALKKKANRKGKEGRYKKTNVVMIGDIPYKVLKKRITVESKRLEAYAKKKSNVSFGSQKKSTIIAVRGIRFQMDPSTRTLKRLEDNNTQETKPLKRIDIGGATYIQTSPGLLTKACTAQTRNLASRVLNKSIQRAWAASQKKNLTKHNTYCMFYNRFGRCNKENKCPYIHDPSKIAVCSRFLRGTCKATDCPFSHEIALSKMAICSFFLEGKCTNGDCPYRHTTISSETELCKAFVKGYCSSGYQCKKAHILACPQYVCQGYCDKGSSCHWPHPPSRGKKRKMDITETNSRNLKKATEENCQIGEVQIDSTSSQVDKTGDNRYFTFGPFIRETCAMQNRDSKKGTDENIENAVNDLQCGKENPQNVYNINDICVKIECISRLRKLPKLPAFIPLSLSDDEFS